MQPTLDIRRHGDGSIDFDFYRRRAMRRRRLARRLFVKRYLTAAKRMAGAGVTIIAYPMVIVAWLRDADASVPAVTLRANGQK